MNAIKEFATSFFIFKLTCSKVIYLKENTLTHSFENHYSKRIKHPLQGFFKGRSDAPLKEGIWWSPWKPKSLYFFLLLDISQTKKTEFPCPLITNHILEKKVSLIAFRRILSKILPEACIFSNTIMTFLKISLELHLLLENSVQQDCLPQLYPIMLLNIYGKPWGWGKIPPKS